MPEPTVLPVGTQLREYEIESVLGAGGFGITYRAVDHHLKRFVALKEYFPSGAAERASDTTVRVTGVDKADVFAWGLERFEDEARMLARFRHPNILRVAQVFRENGTSYMILDYLDGETLQQWLTRTGEPPTQEQMDKLASGLLGALEVVHGASALHRDIAPKNIMLREDFTPILIDFGSARHLVAERHHPLTAVLTPGYAPFEQYIVTANTQGPWTDIYALAATFYQAVTGKVPPESPGRTMSDSYVPAVQAAPRGRFRQSFLQAIDWGMCIRPSDRPQSAAQWRAALLGQGPAPAASETIRIGANGAAAAALPPTKVVDPIGAVPPQEAQPGVAPAADDPDRTIGLPIALACTGVLFGAIMAYRGQLIVAAAGVLLGLGGALIALVVTASRRP